MRCKLGLLERGLCQIYQLEGKFGWTKGRKVNLLMEGEAKCTYYTVYE